MDVFALRNQLIADYAAYIRSFIHIQDERIRRYIDDELSRGLLWPEPDQNIAPAQATQFLKRYIDALPELRTALDQRVIDRGEELLAAHRGVRTAARITGVRYSVEPQLPADVLGVYLLLPAA